MSLAVRLRQFNGLDYVDPRAMLLALQELEIRVVVATGAPARVRNLRANGLKQIREMREACIFCYGMGIIIEREMLVAQAEAQDYDVVARWREGDTETFSPIQIKEVVPEQLNREASVQAAVDGLRKYTDSPDLTVVIHLNRRVQFSVTDIEVPPLNVGGIWVFGANRPDRSRWSIWRLHPGKTFSQEFDYPSVP